MTQNLVSAALTAEAIAKIATHVEGIRAELPFLLDLNTLDRRRLLIMGSGSQGFADDAVTLAEQQSQILPRSFDVAELKKDRDLFSAMTQVQNLIDPLKDMIDDTVVAVGSDLYQGSLEVYTYAKAAGKGAGLEERVKSMGKHFARRRKTKNPDGTED